MTNLTVKFNDITGRIKPMHATNNAPLKGYYPFKMFNILYKFGTGCKCTSANESIYADAAKDENSSAVMVSYFTDDDNCNELISLKLDFVDGANNYEVFLPDNNNDFQSVGSVAVGSTVEMKPNTVILFKSL